MGEVPSAEGDGASAGGYSPTLGGDMMLGPACGSIPIEHTAALKGISECAPMYPAQLVCL